MGTQKITMGRKKDTDYESKKRAAVAQADSANSFMWGMQSVYANGTGAASKASRSPQYGNSNLVTGDMLDGSRGIFKPRQDPAGNQLLGDPINTSGYLDGQTSMTVNPQVDPEIAGQNAMNRIAAVAQGGQYQGLNNRSQVMGI